MIKRSDKRGQGLSTNAIILIVLGVFILAIMIIGFMVGWNRIAPWLSNENVDNIVNSCETACTTKSTFGYCSKPMKLNDGESEFEDTCANFAKGDIIAEGDTPAKNYAKYGIKPCEGLCPVEIPTQ